MSIAALSTDDKDRLKEVITKAAKMKLEAKDINDSVRDLIKNTAEQTGVEKKVIAAAVKYEFKALGSVEGGDIEKDKEDLSDVEELLHVCGII